MKARVCDALMLPLTFALVAGYVAWRFLTCCVDGWADLRHGRVPPIFREGR